jgi:hypothetical protein
MVRQNYRATINHYIRICLYSVVLSGSALAQQAPSNTNIAGPSASATGSVVNQAVQVLQGPYAVNTYGGGVSCQGPTMSIAPFAFGNTNKSLDPETFQSFGGNAGISLGFNFPLDGSLQEICKARAKVEIIRQQAEADKAKLDFALVRLRICGEQIKAGIFYHPDSPYGLTCADVMATAPNGHIMTGNGVVISKPPVMK